MSREVGESRRPVQSASSQRPVPSKKVILMNERTKVLFIAGFFRSGSTILDRLLGQVPGFFSAGELRFAWKESFLEDRPCGCGRPFSGCPFWSAVVEEAYGSRDQVDLDEVMSLKHRVDRMRHIPQLLSPWKPESFRGNLARYAPKLEALYRAIRKVSGAEVIVDSSKDPSYAYVLANLSGLELRMVHLVRDSRAVAYSWQRKKIKYEVAGSEERMPILSPAESSIGWMRSNLLIEPLKTTIPRHVLVRYEDLMVEPATFGKILALAGEEEYHLPLLDGPAVELGENHIVAGNPNRFRRGRMEFRTDVEWEREMSRSDRRKVTALTWPLLLRYGYLGSEG